MVLINVGTTDDDGTGLALVNAGHIINAVMGGGVVDRTVDVGSATATRGFAYIVPASATGAWVGQDDNFAYYDGSAWQFATPDEGCTVYDKTANEYVLWDGTAWVDGPLLDAPSDGTGYVRKDGAWAAESSGSGGSLAPFRGFRAYDNTGSSRTALELVDPVPFDTEQFDTESAFASNVFTVPAALDGKYMRFDAGVQMGQAEAGQILQIKRDTDVIASTDIDNGRAIGISTGPFQVSTGEVWKVVIRCDTAYDISSGLNTFFGGQVIETALPALNQGADITATGNVDLSDFANFATTRHINTASNITLTVQSGNSSVGSVNYYREGTGTVTFAAGAGVTIQSEGGKLGIANQYESVDLIHLGSDVYRLEGSLV